ncbi:MAG: hypothetical protein ACRCYY_05680 [Trueperaceae bacterium]
MMKLRLVIFASLLALLTACGGTVDDGGDDNGGDTLGVTLAASSTSLTEAGPVTLTATVTGEATSVEFFAAGVSISEDDGSDGSYTADVTVSATTTYTATVTGADDVTADSNSVTVTIGSDPVDPEEPIEGEPGGEIPADAVQAADAAAINAAPEGATIVVTGDITCNKLAKDGGDPCIRLKTGQRLVGSLDGQPPATPVVKIIVDIPPGTVFNKDDTAKATAIMAADGSTIEGLSIEGVDVFHGVASPDAIGAGAALTGSVTLKNVSIVGESFKDPIKVKTTGALNLDGLSIANANKRMFLSSQGSLNIKNSVISFNAPATITASPLVIADDAVTPVADIVIDGLSLTSNVAGPTAHALAFDKFTGGNTNITVNNSKFSVPAGTKTPAINISVNAAAPAGGTFTLLPGAGNQSNTDADFDVEVQEDATRIIDQGFQRELEPLL